MNAVPFDTHRFFTELKQAGVPDEQAEVMTRLQQEAIAATLEQAKHDYHLDELATKRDIKELELKVAADMKTLEARMAENKAELIRWVVGAGLLQTTLIMAVLMKIAHLI